ncbi:hypothetical protein DAPPUDRAFT_117941 [Daphnia pulex]|uniref:Uncharacterized protein n=1 Tax=Daphnia pulex TaxID=6669 RepID=E9HU74_DAPPU|nr:hypothetical protein DAPPUDRAFT_117941 [Daphnia pulex]|eukprot:EFX64692.1 hypothetical protein DAPPUDRAFT_117941 [Daphnia pulex]
MDLNDSLTFTYSDIPETTRSLDFQQMYRLTWGLKISTSRKGTRDSSRKHGVIVETHNLSNLITVNVRAGTKWISNDEIQSQILTATESAVAGSAGGLATISAGRRIANESGKVDVSGLRQWITAKPELCQEFQALLHSIKLKEVVEDAIGLVNEDFR